MDENSNQDTPSPAFTGVAPAPETKIQPYVFWVAGGMFAIALILGLLNGGLNSRAGAIGSIISGFLTLVLFLPTLGGIVLYPLLGLAWWLFRSARKQQSQGTMRLVEVVILAIVAFAAYVFYQGIIEVDNDS